MSLTRAFSRLDVRLSLRSARRPRAVHGRAARPARLCRARGARGKQAESIVDGDGARADRRARPARPQRRHRLPDSEADATLRSSHGRWPEQARARALDGRCGTRSRARATTSSSSASHYATGRRSSRAARAPLRSRARRDLATAQRSWCCSEVGRNDRLGMAARAGRFAPLRDTTAAMLAIDPRRLTARIPVRATGDDVDGLAAAINRCSAASNGPSAASRASAPTWRTSCERR